MTKAVRALGGILSVCAEPAGPVNRGARDDQHRDPAG
jgi:hypothetical protein